MRTLWGVLPVSALAVVVVVGACAVGVWPSTARAASPKANACGCFRDAGGACLCGKKMGKCDCPGECEPKGCDEKRAKDLQKEIDAETKRARDLEKKQRDADTERRKNAEAVDNQEEAAAEARLQAAEEKAAAESEDSSANKKRNSKGKKPNKPRATSSDDTTEK